MGLKMSVRSNFFYCFSGVSLEVVVVRETHCVYLVVHDRLATGQQKWAREVKKEEDRMAGPEEHSWDGQVLSSILTGCLRKGMAEGEVASVAEIGFADCGMGYAIGKRVEHLGLEGDQLLAKQECLPSLALADDCRRLRGQKRSQNSRCCVKKPNCSWIVAERDQCRAVVDRQPRGRWVRMEL